MMGGASIPRPCGPRRWPCGSRRNPSSTGCRRASCSALILLPGFSTAREVTEVSGRGVGMDVVKTNIELLEGSLSIDSQPGVGTAMIMRMPLTLAIIPCLIVTVNGERYAIPQRELEEAICLHPGLKGRIEQAFDTEFYRLRDRLLPIIRLREVFEYPRPFTAETKAEILKKYAASNREPVVTEYIVVVRQGRKRFGLLVDDVRGTEEIVVKPMNAAMKRVAYLHRRDDHGRRPRRVDRQCRRDHSARPRQLRDRVAERRRRRGAARKPIVSCCSSTARANSSRCRSCRFAASSRSIRGGSNTSAITSMSPIDGVATRILRLEQGHRGFRRATRNGRRTWFCRNTRASRPGS